jgi:aryl-alcohol dehydrogenase-like predicted oxidoreductase
MLSRLALGTAQFGLDYGITNRNGEVSEQDTAAILDRAHAKGVRLLDTAPAYGHSEETIGKLDPDGRFAVVTKTMPIATGGAEILERDIDDIEREFEAGLGRLRRSSVEGLLVHHGRQIAAPGGEGIARKLEDIRDSGRARKIGVSVYSGAEIDHILERFTPDIIQLPTNVADQRLHVSGHLAQLTTKGIEIHARSLFLQGTLLCSARHLPHFFEVARDDFERIEDIAKRNQISKMQLCLGFAAQQTELDRLIVGATSVAEFDEIAAAAESAAEIANSLDCEITKLSFSHHAILDPSGWPPQEHP